MKRIFKDYLSGKSAKKIAQELNKEGIPAPSGKAWGPSTINGNRDRGTGILNNSLYIGIMVWNRMRYIKNPDTGKRVSRLNPENEWITKDVPELRILDQVLWDKVKEKQGEIRKHSKAFWDKQRPRNLFSFLLKCGYCGGGFSKVSQTHYGCSTARNKGTCSNMLVIRQDNLEGSILNALKNHLMTPELCEIFCKEYTRHVNQMRSEHNSRRRILQKELQSLKDEDNQMVQAIIDGFASEALKESMKKNNERQHAIRNILERSEEVNVILHPNMANHYRKAVGALIELLNKDEHRQEAATILRGLIERIILTPKPAEKELAIDLVGDLAGILTIATSDKQSEEEQQFICQQASLMTKPQELPGVETALQDKVVAGGRSALGLQPPCEGKNIAGAGFEPATFGL